MKKKFIIGALVIWASLLGVFTLNAANNRVQIVSENYASKQLSQDGMHITNVINTTNTDLVNGEVAIEIIIDNSKHSEIIYAIDNGNSMSSIKANVIDQIKTHAKTLEGMSNIKQGIVTTTNGNVTYIPFEENAENRNIEAGLDQIKTISSGIDGEIFDSIEKAATSFSETADEKFIIVALTSMPTDITNLQNTINEYSRQGIKVIVYGINLSNKTNFQNVFDTAVKYELTTSTLNQINYISNVMNYLPMEKPAIASSISFDNYILNNFDVKDINTSNGVARYDTATNQIIWEVGNIKTNETVKLTYFLSLKKYVDESILEKTLRTNRQILVTQSGQTIGTYPADDQIDDQICSPTIMILREAVDNPKTGVANYIIFGACLLAVSAVTILILNSKKQFNRI